jgi:hypothetical protein
MPVLTRAIEAEGEAGAVTATVAALAVTATVMITAPVVTSIVVGDVLALGPDPRSMIDTTGHRVAPDGMTVRMIGTMAAEIAMAVDAAQVQDVAAKHQNPS